MKWCRFQTGAHTSYGIVEDDRVIEVQGSPFDAHTVTTTTHRRSREAPAAGDASRPVCRRAQLPRAPGGHGEAPRRGAEIPGAAGAETALAARAHLFRAKNCDTFKPFGPWIVTGLDPATLRIVVRHNGAVWEDFSSADQIRDTATWIHEMSRTATLHPGDVLWMGTEGADGDMVPGDVIEVEISGIGTLRNYVVVEK